MNYEFIEKELKKRLEYQYSWGRRQTNSFDSQTNFIYKTYHFETLLKEIDLRFKSHSQYLDFRNYTLNRWYNFWSAKAVENIFCEHKIVKPHKNFRDKFIDFYIENIPFDHKTTVFPRGFNKSVNFAIENKKELIKWLYTNQSQQQRKHLKNRIFLVLFNKQNPSEHWKLKSEITWLKGVISSYLANFSSINLLDFSIGDSIIKSDIVWAIK